MDKSTKDDSALRAAHMALTERARSAEDAIEQTWRPEVKALRAALNEALAQNERFNTRYRDSEAENERLRARIIMLLCCHYDEHEHHGSPTCFDIQSPTDEWETAALFHVRWTA